jgi:tape measure domain-containing protein
MTNNGVEYVLSLKDKFNSGIRQATNETEKLNSAVNQTQSSVNSLGGSLRSAFAAIATGVVVNEIVQATSAVETLKNQLTFASGSAQQGAKDFEYITNISKQMGLDLQVAGKAFTQFEAASRGTTLAGQGVKDVFEGVAMASTVMGLSAEQSEGAFLALQQMLSKGKVQAEELRGQLGERIPGAFQIAARAMNMTTSELDKFMSDGKLVASEFLPLFARQLKVEFAGGMDAAKESLNANINILKTQFFELKYTIGELLMPVIKGTIQLFGELIEFGKGLAGVIDRNKTFFAFLGATIGTLTTALFAYRSWLLITTAAQWALNTATAFFEGLTGVGLFAVAAAGAAALAVGIYAASEAQKALNSEITKQPTPQTAFQGVNAKLAAPSIPTQTATKSSGGTSTNVVESKGVQNFNIDINKLVETINIKAADIKEGAGQIKEAVAQALIEAVNDFQLMATK